MTPFLLRRGHPSFERTDGWLHRPQEIFAIASLQLPPFRIALPLLGRRGLSSGPTHYENLLRDAVPCGYLPIWIGPSTPR